MEVEVASRQSGLERQLSSISGLELRLGLRFWRAVAAGRIHSAHGRGLMRGKAGLFIREGDSGASVNAALVVKVFPHRSCPWHQQRYVGPLGQDICFCCYNVAIV